MLLPYHCLASPELYLSLAETMIVIHWLLVCIVSIGLFYLSNGEVFHAETWLLREWADGGMDTGLVT
jgi:hypothetical protein